MRAGSLLLPSLVVVVVVVLVLLLLLDDDLISRARRATVEAGKRSLVSKLVMMARNIVDIRLAVGGMLLLL